MKIYKRDNYLKKIRGFYNDPEMIKIITGIRRCGKSSLLEMIKIELIESGIDKKILLILNLIKGHIKVLKHQNN